VVRLAIAKIKDRRQRYGEDVVRKCSIFKLSEKS